MALHEKSQFEDIADPVVREMGRSLIDPIFARVGEASNAALREMPFGRGVRRLGPEQRIRGRRLVARVHDPLRAGSPGRLDGRDVGRRCSRTADRRRHHQHRVRSLERRIQ